MSSDVTTDARRRNCVLVLLALGTVVAMAMTIGVCVKTDKQLKELREELREADAALKLEQEDLDQRLSNLCSRERELRFVISNAA